MSISDIINSWYISTNPTDEQRQKAEERLKVCETCHWFNASIIPTCSDCGCPIKKKMFSNIKCIHWTN